jgi:hypothetical protein
MEKLIGSRCGRLPPVRLFLEDVERIACSFAEVSEKVELRTAEFSFESVSEFRQLDAERIHELHVQAREPHISLDLSPDGAFLFISQDTPESRGVYEKAREVLLSCKQPLGAVTGSVFGSATAGIVLGFGLALGIWALTKGSQLLVTIAALALFGGVALFFAGLRTRFHEYSVIVLAKRSECKSYWRRNKDAIILVVISGVVGSLVTLLINAILGR